MFFLFLGAAVTTGLKIHTELYAEVFLGKTAYHKLPSVPVLLVQQHLSERLKCFMRWMINSEYASEICSRCAKVNSWLSFVRHKSLCVALFRFERLLPLMSRQLRDTESDVCKLAVFISIKSSIEAES